ncbi:MAG: peptidase C14 [Hyellaceae cyanobacterium CSU_1_1]|nr:peptidase C14 [Hyellaceae cyanobacterium CSU_1_1]
MGLDRRTFLQQAGLALFTWGATEAGISSLAHHNRLAALLKNHQQTLAQPTSRKLALLIGINHYTAQDHLAGCLMDLELQTELLIHRFGFNVSDILTLSDRQATRENIEMAFLEHLTQQAQPDDVVVFHFSGYGGQVKMPLASKEEVLETTEIARDGFRLANSLIPVDGLSSTKKNLIANSILQETILVLAQTLSTAKCTFVLDTSFNQTPRSKHGSFQVRSLSSVADSPSSQELAFLAQLQHDFADKGLKPSKRSLSLPGVVLSAAHDNQVAVERHWDGFSAGLFTQALTQHLWQITPSSKVQVALARTAETVQQVMGRRQEPTLNNPDKSAIAYYFGLSDAPHAAGIISKVDKNNRAEIKLLGLPANVINSYGVNSCFNLVPSVENSAPLQVKSKAGLIAKVEPLAPIEPLKIGRLVQESIRMLNRNLSLKLALDGDLNRVERVDATSALANIPAINSAVVAKEQNADCVIGKVFTALEPVTTNLDNSNQPFTYGLYTAGGDLIGETMGAEEEAVKVAIDRLQPQFNNLLAAKWLELTSNEFSSLIKASATLLTPEIKSPLWQRSTLVALDTLPSPKKKLFADTAIEAANNLPIIARGTEIRLNLGNTDDRQLYTLVLGTDSHCNIYALYTPAQSTTVDGVVQLEEIAIAPQGELVLPPPEDSWKWKVSESPGINTLYVVLSVQPFSETLKAFANQQNFKLDQPQVLNVTNPITVVNALMQDLHNSSSVETKLLANEDVYALDVNSWATLKFVYEVTNNEQ